jgi:hypothetical protein
MARAVALVVRGGVDMVLIAVRGGVDTLSALPDGRSSENWIKIDIVIYMYIKECHSATITLSTT